MGALTTEAFEEIAEDFDFLDDWEDRYRYVIELGKAMTPLEDELKCSATKVDGCASQVWFVEEIRGSGMDANFRFRGDSDAMIVRGLIAILRSLYNGLTLPQVLGTDAEAELGKLGLRDHLTSQRSNGLSSMIARIRAIAARSLAT